MGRSEPSDGTDDALVAAVRGGDSSAFERLLERHEGRVLRVLGLLGVPFGDREDVAQEVFLRVFRHLNGFRRGRSFSAWIYRISVNATHDYRRRSRRHGKEFSADEEMLDGAPPQAGADAERWAERIDRRRRLEEALRVLSERERAVFVLCEMEGLDSPGVARALGISGVTVRRHLGRARRRLQAALISDETEKKGPSD